MKLALILFGIWLVVTATIIYRAGAEELSVTARVERLQVTDYPVTWENATLPLQGSSYKLQGATR